MKAPIRVWTYMQIEHTNKFMFAWELWAYLSNKHINICLTFLQVSAGREEHPTQDDPCGRKSRLRPKEEQFCRTPHRSCLVSVFRGSYSNKFPYMTTRSLGSILPQRKDAKTLVEKNRHNIIKPTNFLRKTNKLSKCWRAFVAHQSVAAGVAGEMLCARCKRP